MKILFVTCANGIDYLSDCVFHGLVKLGHNVVDTKYLWYLSQPITQQQKLSLYGRGFTLSGNLPDRSNIDRSSIKQRICEKEFDCIIYGSICRCRDFIDDVIAHYPKNKIVFCNGEDNTEIDISLCQKGMYFKRELVNSSCGAFPISFAIPAEKIIVDEVTKTLDIAKMIPGTQRNYLYTNEKDYYNGYAIARFGITKKKGGWDCLRHYEIIANKCLPYFEDFEKCPKLTMTNWPSELQIQANYMFKSKDFTNYDILCQEFFNYCKHNLTTEQLAKYVLSKTA